MHNVDGTAGTPNLAKYVAIPGNITFAIRWQPVEMWVLLENGNYVLVYTSTKYSVD